MPQGNLGDGTLPIVDVLLHKLCPLSEEERDEAAELITAYDEALQEARRLHLNAFNHKETALCERIDALLAKARAESSQ